MIKNYKDTHYKPNFKYLIGDMIKFKNVSGVEKYAIFLNKTGEICTVYTKDIRCIPFDSITGLVCRAMYNKSFRTKEEVNVDNIIQLGDTIYRLELLTKEK